METLRYAGGSPTKNPFIVLYSLCRTFSCPPSQIDAEDAYLMERLAYIHYVHESAIADRMKRES